MSSKKNKMVIITSYFDNETYGVLGPQMAATIINRFSDLECMVVGLTRTDDHSLLKKELDHHFAGQRPIIGFSTLSGRNDLFSLAGQLKSNGAVTLLAGPQAGIDFTGEVDCHNQEHRFQGYQALFNYALQGPAEQGIPLINQLGCGQVSLSDLRVIPGLQYLADGHLCQNKTDPWRSSALNRVDWSTLYRLGPSGWTFPPITSAQVLQQIGCPYASKKVSTSIGPPAFMPDISTMTLSLNGCSFCDVAVDKGYCGRVKSDDVMMQIADLPSDADGRKIPFELINENPFVGLPKLLKRCEEEKLTISQINLTTRADYLLNGEKYLREALKMARHMRIRIICVSVGFESFSNAILQNLNKGITLAENLKAVALMRRLKQLFPFQWGYASHESGNHGLIHPTPWDTPRILNDIGNVIKKYDLGADILPPHSTPLIIHHGSGLGDWVRAIEVETGELFNRRGAIIEWWDKDERFRNDTATG